MDARLALANAEWLKKATPAKRAALRQAEKANAQALQLWRQGKAREGLKPAREAVEVLRKLLGEKHPDYATSLNNLALLYQDMGDYKAALPLHKQALTITKEAVGEQHSSYAVSLNNLALLYQDMGDHKAALPLARQALDLRKEVLGTRHPDYASSLNNLAAVYQALKQPEKALAHSEAALTLTRTLLLLAGSVQSERQQLAAAEEARRVLNLRLSLSGDAKDAIRCCDHVLAWKGAVFAAQRQRDCSPACRGNAARPCVVWPTNCRRRPANSPSCRCAPLTPERRRRDVRSWRN